MSDSKPDPKDDPDLDEDGATDVEWFPLPEAFHEAADELEEGDA